MAYRFLFKPLRRPWLFDHAGSYGPGRVRYSAFEAYIMGNNTSAPKGVMAVAAANTWRKPLIGHRF